MVCRRTDDLDWTPVTTDGARACYIRELLTARDGAPTFAMRRFRVDPGGNTPLHSHPWEHEVFVLTGNATVKRDAEDVVLNAGDALLIMPNELHSFVNAGASPLEFLCMIPVEQVCCR
ncbi:MAG: cupin domain-containing protein [Chthonomonadales bacterium]|nr:cupin domain-containing protein [Chthonomonadales bacterium]